jgi:hypothetical protein
MYWSADRAESPIRSGFGERRRPAGGVAPTRRPPFVHETFMTAGKKCAAAKKSLAFRGDSPK